MAKRGGMRDRVAVSILETAALVLAERGNAANMADIATAADVGRATLYRYFPSRAALLHALAELALEELDERVADAQLDSVSVPEGIARLARAFVTTGSKYVALMHFDQKPMDPAEVDGLLGEPLRDLFRRGVADGSLRGDISSDLLLAMFASLVDSAIRMTRDGRGVEGVSSALTTVFLHGSLAQS